MRVYLETTLDCPADVAWAEAQTSRLLLEIITPLLRFDPLPDEKLPDAWRQDSTVRGRAYAFRLLLLGMHSIFFERVSQTDREILTQEQNSLIRRWDHAIRVREAHGVTRYSDEVEIDAGWLTPLVWLYARCFYQHRQSRWRAIARRLARAPPER